MKKKNFFIGASALLLMAGMNFSHALNEYGFLDGNLCANILAQTTTTGTGGSSSTGGSSTGGSSSSSGSSSSTGGSSTGDKVYGLYKTSTREEGPYDSWIDGEKFRCKTFHTQCEYAYEIGGTVTCDKISYSIEVCLSEGKVVD